MLSNDNGQDKSLQKSRLLSPQEREAFKMISTGNDLHGQRALALLAIDEGATQEQAAQRSGLTAGQVKYWLGKFRQVRMAIFPEQVLMADRSALEQETPDQGAKVANKSEESKKTKKSPGVKSKKKPKTKKGKKSKKKKARDKAKKKGAKKKKKAT
jgi:hypothetical protein